MTCKQNTSKSTSIASEQECVKNILKLDDSLGKIRNNQCKQISLSKTITNYSNSLNSLNFEGCPESFSNAFKKHIKAWSEMKTVTNKYPDLRGEMHDLFDLIEVSSDSATFKPLLKNIWDTWEVIEQSVNKK